MTEIDGRGTPEREWQPFLDSLELPPLALDPAPARAVVVAPHPDDEVLGVGGLLTLLHAVGTRLDVLCVTDGEASHPGGSVSPEALAPRRVAETDAALAVLGVRAGVRRLQLPDGGREALEQPVADALRLEPGTWLLGPWAGDGHPDHEAVGRGCARAVERDGARLLAYPVWAWHWACPGDPRVPWKRALQVGLPPDLRLAKARAVAEFVTQVQPLGPAPADATILLPHMLEHFARPYEVVLT
ncbi:MAG: PIG-L deacetylase family protein [Mycobacteriales bacterium]